MGCIRQRFPFERAAGSTAAPSQLAVAAWGSATGRWPGGRRRASRHAPNSPSHPKHFGASYAADNLQAFDASYNDAGNPSFEVITGDRAYVRLSTRDPGRPRRDAPGLQLHLLRVDQHGRPLYAPRGAPQHAAWREAVVHQVGSSGGWEHDTSWEIDQDLEFDPGTCKFVFVPSSATRPNLTIPACSHNRRISRKQAYSASRWVLRKSAILEWSGCVPRIRRFCRGRWRISGVFRRCRAGSRLRRCWSPSKLGPAGVGRPSWRCRAACD